MRQTRRYIPLALMSALSVAACSDRTVGDTKGSTTTSEVGGTTDVEPTTGEPIDPEVYEQCKAYNANFAKLQEADCTCIVASGEYPDLESCLADYQKSPEEADCICFVYGKRPEKSKVVLDCFTPPMQTLLECFLQAECSDAEAQQACFSANSAAVFQCPYLSQDIEFQISIECRGEAPFMCASGEQIPESYTCDSSPNCIDGSDEAGCSSAGRHAASMRPPW